MNLLNETRDFLTSMGVTESEVEWVGSEGYAAMTWDQFAVVGDVEYDNGFGGQEIADDLVVVGADWWLSREEYDGSEGWIDRSGRTKPNRPSSSAPIRRVWVGPHGGWKSLATLNANL